MGCFTHMYSIKSFGRHPDKSASGEGMSSQ